MLVLYDQQKKCIHQLMKGFDYDSRIQKDPVQFPHRYKSPEDQEIAGFISALTALGKVELIIKNLEKIFSLMGSNPYKFVVNWDEEKSLLFNGFKYRFYNSDDIKTLFWAIGRVLSRYGSLQNLFLEGYLSKEKTDSPSFQKGLEHLSNTFLKLGETSPYKNQRKYGHFFPKPSAGSACKRLCLFLRWMARPAPVDLNLWKEVSASHLIIPVDAHIGRIGKYLGFTNKNTSSWKMAEEITNSLKLLDPEDPLRYDFFLCHLGISGECPGKYTEEKCTACGLREMCVRR